MIMEKQAIMEKAERSLHFVEWGYRRHFCDVLNYWVGRYVYLTDRGKIKRLQRLILLVSDAFFCCMQSFFLFLELDK